MPVVDHLKIINIQEHDRSLFLLRFAEHLLQQALAISPVAKLGQSITLSLPFPKSDLTFHFIDTDHPANDTEHDAIIFFIPDRIYMDPVPFFFAELIDQPDIFNITAVLFCQCLGQLRQLLQILL